MFRNLLLLICFFAGTAVGQSDDPFNGHVDERTELMCIVARLAGYSEYCTTDNKAYVDAIMKHFSGHANHPLIDFARKIRSERNMAYDAVAAMSMALEPPPKLTLRVPIAQIDSPRWDEETANRFVELLQDFYAASDCHAFFKSQAGYYKEVEKSMRDMYKDFNNNWFPEFYGDPSPKSFTIIFGPALGNNNYGSRVRHPGKSDEIYSVTSIYSTSSIIVHEFNHSYANPLVERHIASLEEPGKRLFGKCEQQMKKQAYSTWETMIKEYIVRAATIRYMMANKASEQAIQVDMMQNVWRGFAYMPGLVRLLDNYEKNRDKYPTLDDFMPEFVSYFEQVSSE